MYRVALVVGINHYSTLAPLRAPAADAEATARRLEKLGFQVTRLPDVQKKDGAIAVGEKSAVSLSELEQKLKWLFHPAPKQVPDIVLLYFSGHGTVNEVTGEGFLAASDVRPKQNSYGFPLRILKDWLRECPAQQQIVWLDCCNSASFINLYEADPGYQGHARDRCFIAAAYEAAYELLTGHGALTSVLLKALDPDNYPGGWITNLALVDFLNRQWEQSTQLETHPQHPIYANFGRSIDLTLTHTSPPEPSIAAVCPYKYLTYFDFNDQDPKNFFGRTALISRLIERVQQSNFLAVLGASGSGKSSVVRAGLLHQLQQGLRISGSAQWKIQLFRPGSAPLTRLREACLHFISEPGQTSEPEQRRKVIDCIEEGGAALGNLLQASTSGRLILAIDQFEEVFTQCQNLVDRQLFLECLLSALNHSNNKLRVVLVMRSDFLDKCAEKDYAGLSSKLQQPDLVIVPPMTEQELREAIVEPARQGGREVEPKLVKQMLIDMDGAPGNLPLLQYTLTKLWEKPIGNRLALESYIELDGVMGALEQQANKVYEELSQDERKTVQQIFLALTQVGDGDTYTRKRVYKQDLITSLHSEGLVERVIQKLTNRNLLVTDYLVEKGEKANESDETSTVEVAHEALIRHWSKLRDWVNENREALPKQQSIEKAAEEWRRVRKPKDPAYLLQGIKLEAAQEFVQTHLDTLPLSLVAQEFIKVSQEEHDRLQREEEERNQREQEQLRKIAEEERRVWEAEALAFQAEQVSLQEKTARLSEQVEAEAKLALEAEKARIAAEKKTRYAIAAAVFAVSTLGAFVFGFTQIQANQKLKLIAASIGLLPPPEAEPLLKNALNEATEYSNKGEIDKALEYYRNIRKTARKYSYKSIDEKAEESIVNLISTEFIQKKIEQYIEDPKKIGRVLTEDEAVGSSKKFGDEDSALKETYEVLMVYTGADIDNNNKLDNNSEAALMPCEILRKLEEIWHRKGCSWDNPDSKEADTYDDKCNVLDRRTLMVKVFDPESWFYVRERLKYCHDFSFIKK